MNFIYAKHAIFFLFLGLINQQAYSMNCSVAHKPRPYINHLSIKKQIKAWQEQSLSSKEPQITCSFLHSEKTLTSTAEILSQSGTLKGAISNFNYSSLTKNCINTNLSYEDFNALYPAMLLLAHNKSNKINGLYHGQSTLSLTKILNTTDFLDIPDLENIITTNIAKKCDNFHAFHASPLPQNQIELLKQIYTLLQDKDLHKKILSKMKSQWPLIYSIPLSETDQPRETWNSNKTIKRIYEKGKEATTILYTNRGEMRLNEWEGDQLDNNNNHFFYKKDQTDSELINLTNVDRRLTIKNVWPFCHNNGKRKIGLFTEKYLVTRTYNNDLFTYKIIDISQMNIIKFISGKNITDIFFYCPNKLFIETNKTIFDSRYSIALIDLDTDSTITFDNIATHTLNSTQSVLIYLNESNTVTMYDLNKNKETSIPLKENLIYASIICHPKNNTFLIQGKTKDKTYKVFLYNQSKSALKEISSFADRKLIQLDWSSSGDNILCNTKNKNTKINNIDCFNIKEDKITNLINSENYTYTIHPKEDIIHLNSFEDGNFIIYNLSTKEKIGNYIATNFCKDYTGYLITPTDYLSKDNNFLIIKDYEKYHIVTNSGLTCYTLPTNDYNIHWKHEKLFDGTLIKTNNLIIKSYTTNLKKLKEELNFTYHDYDNDENIKQSDLL